MKSRGTKNLLRSTIVVLFCLLVILSIAKPPRLTAEEINVPPPSIIRTCCAFGTNLGIVGVPFYKKTDITSLHDLGQHHYLGNENEGNGNIYTRSGGFIDLAHLRDCADWTAYLYSVIIAKAVRGDSISIDLGHEGGTKTLIISIPQDFDKQDAYQLAGKIAYDISLWHEIATWFGASYIPMIPEQYSSFSPEDLYSNLLGINLGIQALKSNLEYDDAMTLLISNVLNRMEAVSTFEETYSLMEKVENIWWTNDKPLPSKKLLLKRYFDADSCLSPWLVPGEISQQSPFKLYKPNSQLTELYQLRIKLNFKFPKLLFSNQNHRTITQKDFSTLMDYIRKDVLDLEIKIAQRNQRRKEKRSRADMYHYNFKSDSTK